MNATVTNPSDSFRALALQVTCQAVNQASDRAEAAGDLDQRCGADCADL